MGDTSDGSRLSRDVLLGKLAQQKGWITSSQLRTALVDVAAGRAAELSEVLVSNGFLTTEQLHQLLAALARAATPSFPPFGKYTLHREIGRGAMGVVYEAEEAGGARVALKLLIEPPGRDAAEARIDHERFVREAELLRKLPDHPGLVRILEAGVLDGRRYLAMELVDGVPFHQWRKAGSISVRQQVAVLRDAALAMHHAHEQGVIHRDLKPENILVDRQHRPRVTDFGLAKLSGSVGLPTLTASGAAVGTPAYMSPEQIQGLKTVDRRTDLYSLGVMLYELLTGRRPFAGDSPYELMMRAVNEAVVPPSKITNLQINPVLYRNLENICLISLAKNPADRYPDAASFARDLTRWLRGEEFKLVVPRAWRLWRAKKFIPRIALAVSLALAATAGWMWLDVRRHRLSLPPALPAAAIPVERLHPGAVVEYFAGLNRNALALRQIDTRERFDDPKRPVWGGHHGYWTSRRWTGHLRVYSTDTYVFSIGAEEGASVLLDGEELNTGGSSLPITRTLAAGAHTLVIEHGHKGPDDTLRLSWNRHGETTMIPLGPAALFHDPAAFQPLAPPAARKEKPGFIPGAEEGERLAILDDSGRKTSENLYATGAPFWKGRWSGEAHLAWGSDVSLGDRLKLRFSAGESGPATLALGLTRTSDHGIFRILVNGREVAAALDLFHDSEMLSSETEFKDVPLLQGSNVLEFVVVGSNPKAREWGGGSGLHKLGLDYVLVK